MPGSNLILHHESSPIILLLRHVHRSCLGSRTFPRLYQRFIERGHNEKGVGGEGFIVFRYMSLHRFARLEEVGLFLIHGVEVKVGAHG